MTLYVAFDVLVSIEVVLDDKVVVSKNAASEAPVKLGLRGGQSLWQHSFENCFKELALNHYIYIQVVRGKMGTTNVSTERYDERS